MIKIMELVHQNRHDILKGISQYNVHSAWSDVLYGCCPFGIFSATTPVEPLHALENGPITNCVHILFEEEIAPGQKPVLDALVWYLTDIPRQCYASSGTKPLMPCLLWKDGITSLLEGTTNFKEMAIMFTITVMSLQDEEKILLEEVLGSNANLNNMCQVFQMMLACCWVWIRKEMYWIYGEVVVCEGVGTAIRTMLRDLLRPWPCNVGQGLKKSKTTSSFMSQMTLIEMVHARIITLVQQSPTIFSMSNVFPSPMEGESLQSSKGFVYVNVADDGSFHGCYQAVTGDLEHSSNDMTDHLDDGALHFLAGHYGRQLPPVLNVADETSNVCLSWLFLDGKVTWGELQT
jgi:hypothetical protein